MAQALSLSSYYRFLPFLDWLLALKRDQLRPDLEAGLISAILILPQAIALATLAGMPPEYGIYTSIFPVVVASFWGSSHHLLSGPNTAMCVMLAAAVAPFANTGNEYYIGFVLALTFMVGTIQFVMGTMKLGAILDFISHTVISAIILAVALVMIVSALSPFQGLLFNIDDVFAVRVYQVIHDIPRANIFSVIVGSVTVLTGLFAKRFVGRYALLVAVLLGSLSAWLLNTLFGSASTSLEMIGFLNLSLLPLSNPSFDLESMYVLKELVTSAIAIAFLGLMQTVVIARGLAKKSSQLIDTNQEILGQGLSNLVAPFISSFAGSGSFNRSAAHYAAGARTPMASLFASLFLAVIVFVGTSLIVYIPMATVAGVLILVGINLIDIDSIKDAFRSRQETVIYVLTFTAALSLGLNAGVFTGLFLSLCVYLWKASTPNILVSNTTARDGIRVYVVTIDGNLFFGSVRHVEKVLAGIHDDHGPCYILLRTDHITYLDMSGAAMISSELNSRRLQGDDLYVYVTRDSVLEVLSKSGCLQLLGQDNVIRKGLTHPMSKLLFPDQHAGDERINQNAPSNSKSEKEDENMEMLAKRLRNTRLLGSLSTEQISHLLEEHGVSHASSGDILVDESKEMHDHIILIEGEVEAQRTWSVPGEFNKSHTWHLKPGSYDGGFAFLGAMNRIRVRALNDIRYVTVNADCVDDLLGWKQQFSHDLESDPELKRRMDLVKQVSIFHNIPLENIKQVFQRMYRRDAQAGETIITQGDKGDCYYLMDAGEAEVHKADPFTDEVQRVATFGPGDAFGEESLLQDAYRNATVTMTTPGKLLVLDKQDFDELLKPHVIEEIVPDDAKEMISSGKAKWIDCRYDMEFEESRIPGAQWMTLDRLRWDVHALDPDATYIVYCRSGRRSQAGAFILRERNIKAYSLAGGIKDWPYEIDGSEASVDTTQSWKL